MARFIATTIALFLLAQTLCETTHADQQKNRKKQNNGQQAQARAAGQLQSGRMNQAAQPRQGQMAQRMITMFDRDGDAALNLVELQAGLTALFESMSRDGMQGAMGGAGVNQANGRGATEAPLRKSGGQAGAASGFRGGPRGR